MQLLVKIRVQRRVLGGEVRLVGGCHKWIECAASWLACTKSEPLQRRGIPKCEGPGPEPGYLASVSIGPNSGHLSLLTEFHGTRRP